MLLLNFDRFLIERVFQPFINATRADPVHASLFFVTGGIFVVVISAVLQLSNPIITFCALWVAVIWVDFYKKIVKHQTGPIDIGRLIALFFSTGSLLMLVMSHNTWGEVLQYLSPSLLTIACYLASCQKPPRRERLAKTALSAS